jgi:hypothetical protein
MLEELQQHLGVMVRIFHKYIHLSSSIYLLCQPHPACQKLGLYYMESGTVKLKKILVFLYDIAIINKFLKTFYGIFSIF